MTNPIDSSLNRYDLVSPSLNPAFSDADALISIDESAIVPVSESIENAQIVSPVDNGDPVVLPFGSEFPDAPVPVDGSAVDSITSAISQSTWNRRMFRLVKHCNPFFYPFNFEFLGTMCRISRSITPTAPMICAANIGENWRVGAAHMSDLKIVPYIGYEGEELKIDLHEHARKGKRGIMGGMSKYFSAFDLSILGRGGIARDRQGETCMAHGVTGIAKGWNIRGNPSLGVGGRAQYRSGERLGRSVTVEGGINVLSFKGMNVRLGLAVDSRTGPEFHLDYNQPGSALLACSIL